MGHQWAVMRIVNRLVWRTVCSLCLFVLCILRLQVFRHFIQPILGLVGSQVSLSTWTRQSMRIQLPLDQWRKPEVFVRKLSVWHFIQPIPELSWVSGVTFNNHHHHFLDHHCCYHCCYCCCCCHSCFNTIFNSMKTSSIFELWRCIIVILKALSKLFWMVVFTGAESMYFELLYSL